MTVNNLISCRFPLLKCGVETIGLGLFGLGTSIFASEWQSQEAASQNAKNREWQSKEAQKQRDWQEHMYDRSIDEWQNQFDQQRTEWYNQLRAQYGAQWEQFVKQTDYNSPKMQVQRLAQAGINPAAALNSGSAGGLISASSLGSQASPAPPSGGTLPAPGAGASAGSPAQFNPISVRAEMISSIGGFLRDLSSAAKTSEEAKQVQDLALAQIRKLISDEQWQKSITNFQDIQNRIAKSTENVQVNKAIAELGDLYVDIGLKQLRGELFDEEILNAQVARTVSLIEGDNKLKEGQLLALQLLNFDEDFRESINLKKALQKQALGSASQSYASAGYFSALTNTENATREQKIKAAKLDVEMMELNRDILSNDAQISKETVTARIEQMLEQARREELVSDELFERIKNLKKQNEWYDAKTSAEIFDLYKREFSSGFNTNKNPYGNGKGVFRPQSNPPSTSLIRFR